MIKNQIINGFGTEATGVVINTSNDIGLMLFYKSESQKKAFVKLYLESDFEQREEKELKKEADTLFDEERFDKTIEYIIRNLADQSVDIKKANLNIIKKIFIFR